MRGPRLGLRVTLTQRNRVDRQLSAIPHSKANHRGNATEYADDDVTGR